MVKWNTWCDAIFYATFYFFLIGWIRNLNPDFIPVPLRDNIYIDTFFVIHLGVDLLRVKGKWRVPLWRKTPRHRHSRQSRTSATCSAPSTQPPAHRTEQHTEQNWLRAAQTSIARRTWHVGLRTSPSDAGSRRDVNTITSYQLYSFLCHSVRSVTGKICWIAVEYRDKNMGTWVYEVWGTREIWKILEPCPFKTDINCSNSSRVFHWRW